MSGGTPSNTTTTTKQELPAWLSNAAQQNIAKATELGNQPFQPYTGQLAAGLTPQQQQAFGMSQAAIGNYQPYLTAGTVATADAKNLLNQITNVQAPQGQASTATAGNLAGTDLSAYMNPYTQNVIDTSLGSLDRTRQQQLQGVQSQAAAAKAFGGSRQGVVEALTNEAALRESGSLASQLNAANFAQAQQGAIGDINRQAQTSQFNAGQNQQASFLNANLSQNQTAQQLQAVGLLNQTGQQFGQLGALQSELYGRDISRELGIGNQLQDDNQFALDQAYQQYLRAQQYPIDMLNLRVGATAQTPYGQSGSVTQPAPTRNRTAGALGGAATGAAAGSTFGPWGTAIGGLLGGAYGYFGG